MTAYETKITPDKVVNVDELRDVVVITNLTTRTIYVGDEPDLSTDNGTPIFNNGRFEASKFTGFDPHKAWYLIDTVAGGDVRVLEGRL
ncbi:hypothetical protein KAR91_44235 [Candidatus Pacearchaeota archaeon]|nr:hypothetical protein [Candidatus Pacearchaeota archaeon]